MSKETLHKWVPWAITVVMFAATAVGWWNDYHNDFATSEELTAVEENAIDRDEALRQEATAQAASLFMTQKNISRGRLAAYDGVPEDEQTAVEKKNKQIIEFDLQNIEMIEQAVGLKTLPEKEL